MRVLVVEDEKKLGELLGRGLREEGYAADVADRGEEALWMARAVPYDAIVLDVMLPGADGFEVCRRLRHDGVWTPVLMLTARDGVDDRVVGLDAGADDYLTKPFSPRELVARVKAILRRAEPAAPAPEVIEVGGAVIDLGRREVRAGGAVIDMTGKEFELLRYLAENRGRALSRQQILDGVWGYGWYGDARTVDVHVAQVRKKLGGAVDITTVRGVGYRLDPPS